MIKKLLVISTATMIMFSPVAFARGGNGSGGTGKAYRGSMSQGTVSQIRTQIKSQTQTKTQIQSRSKLRDGSGVSTSGAKGSGDRTREKRQDKLQDGSCEE